MFALFIFTSLIIKTYSETCVLSLSIDDFRSLDGSKSNAKFPYYTSATAGRIGECMTREDCYFENGAEYNQLDESICSNGLYCCFVSLPVEFFCFVFVFSPH